MFVRLGEAAEQQSRVEVERAAAAELASQAREATFARPTTAQLTPLVVLTGSLEPVQAADLAFEVAGRVSRVDVSLGEHVREGQVLAALDRASVGVQSAQSEAAIGVAEANVAMLRDRVTLLTRLSGSGAAASRDLTTAQQQLAVAEAQLRQAEAARRQVRSSSADHVLRAPFDGVVTFVPNGTGGMAAPGLRMIRVEDLTSLRLRTTVSRSELEVLSPGDEAILQGSGAVGTVASLVRSLDIQTRRAPLEVLVPNPEGTLVANSLVRAHVRVGAPVPALRIPATARRPDGSVLLVGEGERIEARMIEATADLDGSWLVREGLTTSDRVIVRAASLRAGDVVQPVEAGATDPAPSASAGMPSEG